ncbi:DUF222 domain-containing protein [Nocardioides caeni]|uniref:DUF222 domain-containing protein n=1 Tax=Nocardioides caeni TaxID=574700 RepID=UPI0013052C23
MTTPRLRDWRRTLALIEASGEPAELIDELRALEELVCAAQARQLRVAQAFDVVERARQAEEGVPARRQGRGVAEQIALARRESPHRGRQHLALARIAHELPHTMAAFRFGLITEWRATVVARETACLEAEHRSAIDQQLAADHAAFAAMSDREVHGTVRRLTAELDPAAVAKRRRKAESERCVTIRPAPDTMAYVTALLPVAQGVAVYATLKAEADQARAAGDERSRGQVMADTLVTRTTGCATTEDGAPVVPVTVGVVMTDAALLTGAHDPAALTDHGPIPADLARELIAANVDADLAVWIRRLYASHRTGQLIAMDSRQRRFPRLLGEFLRHRDQWCRTPWCNAPIRHLDHVDPVAEGGATTAESGQGYCEACNYAKQAPGWRQRPRAGPEGHVVETTTPTGHTYRSHAPPAAGQRRPSARHRDDQEDTQTA